MASILKIMTAIDTTSTSATLEVPVIAAQNESLRCLHRFANGKRCRQPGLESQSGLCSHHFRLSSVARGLPVGIH